MATRSKNSSTTGKRASIKAPRQIAEDLEAEAGDWQLFSSEEKLWIERKTEGTRTRTASSKRPVTIVLPGILGSRIDVEYNGKSRVGWLDLRHVPGGRLGTLRLGAGQPKGWAFPDALQFTGSKDQTWLRNHIIYSNYYPTLVALQSAGHETWFHPYDWRQPIAEIGKSLAKWIGTRFDGRKVNFVGHSMGGIVAKTALDHGGFKCVPGKLVSAGTPWLGAASPLVVMRQLHEFAVTLARCDLAHNGYELADVFATFPGLLGLLPRYAEDWSDLGTWPAGNHPAPTMRSCIREAVLHFPAIQADLPDGWKHHAILGDGVRAITGIHHTGHEFAFDIGRGSDGTVPHRSGHPEGYGWFGKAWYVHSAKTPRGPLFGGKEELAEHGKLLKRPVVADAVTDLLKSDSCTLPSTRAVDDKPDYTRSETQLRQQSGKLRSARAAARAPLADPVATTEAEDDIMRIVPGALFESLDTPMAPSLDEGMRDALSEGPAIGSHMIYSQRRDIVFEIELAFGDITETTTPMIVLAQFQGLPPSTAALYLDEAMNGELVKWIKRRQAAHSAGELDIIPTGRHYIMSEMVGFLGLGQWSSFNRDVFRTSVQSGVHSLLACHISEFSTVIMTGALQGGQSLSLENALSDILVGLVAALKSDASGKVFRRIVIVEHDAGRFLEIRNSLPNILSGSAFGGVTASVTTSRLPSRNRAATEGVRSARERATKSDRSATLYLKLNTVDEGSNPGNAGPPPPTLFDFDAHLRIGSSGASVTVEETLGKRVNASEITAIHRLVGVGTDGGVDDAEELHHATEKVSAFLSEGVRTAMRTVSGPLQIIHDAEPTRVPWESLADGPDLSLPESYPALRGGLSRLFVNTRARRLLAEPPGEKLRVLMVIDPTDDLTGAVKESKNLRKILQEKGRVDVDYLEKSDATKANLVHKLETRIYDIIHYAGHSAFDASNPEQAGLLLSGYEYFTASDVLGLARFPPVIVLNSCESARVRRRGTRSSDVFEEKEKFPDFSLAAATAPMKSDDMGKRQKKELNDRPRGILSIAEGFLLSGIEHFVGTFWPVGDQAAMQFSARFYSRLARGESIGTSILSARTDLFKDGKADWANYIHYGDPSAILFENPTSDS